MNIKFIKLIFIFAISVILISCLINASEMRYELQEKLEHGHVLYIDNVILEPSAVAPGSPMKLKFTLENFGKDVVRDIRITLSLPTQFTTFNDITKRKIPELMSDTPTTIDFNLLALPDADEGVYSSSLYLQYINPVGTEITENVSVGLFIGGIPKVFVEVESSDIYKGHNIGEITLKFVNNDISNIKFLTIQLEGNEDFEIISADKEYIGDLESDDSESVDFRIKTTTKKDSIELPLIITYKDSLNREYTQKLIAVLPIRSAVEMGISQNNTGIILLIIFVVFAIAAFIIYKRYKRRKNAKRLS